MRKTIIALILVIPMMFVLIVFSSAKIASLGVDISVNGIRILADSVEDGTLYIDMAEDRVYSVSAEVSPGNAKNQGYQLSSDEPDVVDVAPNGDLLPKGEGTAHIIATSDDKGYTDRLTVVVAASKPYSLDFSMADAFGKPVALEETETGLSASLSAGRYSYKVSILPSDFTGYTIEGGDYVFVNEGKKEILLPFSGKTSFTVTVPDAVGGSIEKNVSLDVRGLSPQTGITVNGERDGATVSLDREAKTATLYVECNSAPAFSSQSAEGKVVALGGGRYRVEVAIAETFDGDTMSATLTVDGKQALVTFNFSDFDFHLTSDGSDLPVTGEQPVPVGTERCFYAVSSVSGTETEYEWSITGAPESYLVVAPGGTSCTVKADAEGTFTVRVRAMRGGEQIGDPIEFTVNAIQAIWAVRISEAPTVDLAECYTVPGKVYDDGMQPVQNSYVMRAYTFTPGKPKGNAIDYSLDNEELAEWHEVEGGIEIVPLKEGKLTVTASWKWNSLFPSSTSKTATLTLNLLPDAVGVKNAPEYVQATEAGEPVVLLGDILLGTDREGNPLDDATLEGMFGRAKSTYNIEWYKHAKDNKNTKTDVTEQDAYISCVSEIKNDIYGNGFSIDADRFTHALDGNDNPRFKCYRNPLYFVDYNDGSASVSGQDNCAFLIRTKGVTLYGVSLLGCSDESLYENDKYMLNNLNHVGTTLEINADCSLINCRIRNGRNVVRVYGGNQKGDRYFIDTLSANTGCDSERIHVNIEGCILSQSREFILKIGANRALRASMQEPSPCLTDASGNPYDVKTKNWYELADDPYFYKQYVMTDVTLKNSVLETSGLFTVGIESNFSGEFLYRGAGTHDYSNFTKSWEYSGGTSFASVLRLEGDVRLYDWKDLSLVDSSTLIESHNGVLKEWLKLDVQKMIDYVYTTDSAVYGEMIDEREGQKYVHGGIAFYGGGRNYSHLDLSKLDEARKDLLHMNINISILATQNTDPSMKTQGTLLPKAAGLNDFNFFVYGKSSANNYDSQYTTDARTKYAGVKPVPVP